MKCQRITLSETFLNFYRVSCIYIRKYLSISPKGVTYCRRHFVEHWTPTLSKIFQSPPDSIHIIIKGSFFFSGEKEYILQGDWTDQLYCYPAKQKVSEKVGQVKSPSMDSTTGSTLIAGSCSSNDTSDDDEDNERVLLWKVNPRPPNSEKVIIISVFVPAFVVLQPLVAIVWLVISDVFFFNI